MNNILILGSLPQSDEQIKLYEVIIEIVQKFAKTVKSPIDTVNFKGDEQERYERAFRLVKEADLVIAEQSQPSTGQGMEIRECAILNKSLIVVAKEGSKISGLVKGCPVVKEIIFYQNIEDLRLNLEQIISRL